MPLAPGYGDRPDVQVAILEALVDRNHDGMTVFEVRSEVDADIDRIESALSALKEDGLITVDDGAREGSAVIKPAERVLPAEADDRGPSTLERLRELLPF